MNRAPNNDTCEYSWGRATVRRRVTWGIGRKYESDLERDRHKVCIARKPEQRTQSLCCLDGPTQSLIRRGKRCPVSRLAGGKNVSCWLLCYDLAKQCVTVEKITLVINVQHSTFARRRQLTSLFKSWTRLWVVHTRQLDFESVVLFSRTTPLNQTLSRSTSPPYILRYYSSRLFTTITTIIFSPRPFTAIGAIPPFLNNPWVCHSVPCPVSIPILINIPKVPCLVFVILIHRNK